MPRRRRLKFRRARSGRITRAMFKRQMIGHQVKGVRYALAGSYRGLRAMASFGFKWADRDTRRTADDVYVVIHWLRDWRVPRGFPHKVEQMTAEQVLSLVAVDGGWRVHSLDQDFRLLGQLGMGAYVEPKAPDTIPDVEHARRIKALGDKYGVPVRGYALKANAANLAPMNSAGIHATRLNK